MKEWIVDYSVKWSDESIDENRLTVEAETVYWAVVAANQRLQEMVDENDNPYVEDAVIWNIGMIVEDDLDPLEVFG